MDGKATLTISNCNFDDYSMIILHCTHNGTATTWDGSNSGNIYLSTIEYGTVSYSWLDLTGDDWCGAYLVNNTQIKLTGGAGVYVNRVYGV